MAEKAKLFDSVSEDIPPPAPPPAVPDVPPEPAKPIESVMRGVAGWADRKDVECEVLDTTARIIDGKSKEQSARVHTQIINGVHENHRFLPGEWTRMPFDHAMKYLRVAEFRVRVVGETDLMTRPLDIQDLLRPVDPAILPVDQCVAEFTELHADALLVRCKMLPGGEAISNRSGRAGMIAFLTAARKKRMEQRRYEEGLVAPGDTQFQEMSSAQMERMLPETDPDTF